MTRLANRLHNERACLLNSSSRPKETHAPMSTDAKPNPIPTRYRRITPALIVNSGNKALEFYRDVFGATERMRFPGPDGTVAHAEIEIGDSIVIVEDQSPYMGTQAPPAEGL